MRSSLSVMGVMLAVGSAVALVSLGHAIETNAIAGYDERGADVVLSRRGASDMFSGQLSQKIEPDILATPGVEAVAGEIIMFSQVSDGVHVLISGWTPDSFFWSSMPLAAGRAPTPADQRVVLLGDSVAQTLGKTVGDTLEMMDESFKVIGITKYQSVLNRSLVIMPIADLQEATFRTGQVTIFHLRLRKGISGDEFETLRARLASLGPVMVSKAEGVLRNDRYLAVLNAVALAVSLIALSMGVLNVLNTLLMAVQERTREIGIVAAIGWSDARIVGLILIEGALIGLHGCVGGAALGYFASGIFSAIPAIGEYIAFRPTAKLMAEPAALGFLLCLCGSLYPAWRAVRMTPAEALRRI